MRGKVELGAVFVLAPLAILACFSNARAETTRGIELEWRAPPGCPDANWAHAALESYFGPHALDALQSISVRVELSAVVGGRYRAAISVDGGASGDRRFEGATCDRVSDAAVLIVALMLDPAEVVTQIETPPAVPRREAPTRSADVLRRSSDRPANRAGSPTVFELGVATAGDAGSLPEPTVGAGLGAGLRLGRTLIEADALVWVPRRVLAGPTSPAGGELGLYTVGLRSCWAVLRSAESGISVEPCLRAEGGVATGRGFGIAEPATSKNLWAATYLGVSIRQWSTAALGGWLTIEGGVPFVRANYVIEDLGPVFRASPLVGRVSLGLAWSFP